MQADAQEIQLERDGAELALERGGVFGPAALEKAERGIEQAEDVAKIGGRH